MNLRAVVLHNVNPEYMFQKYAGERSTLAHAHEFEVTADTPANALELIWVLTNVGDENELATMRPDLSQYGAQVRAYRNRRNRSLSVGDVVVIFDRDAWEWDGRIAGAFSVEAFGWSALPLEPPYDDGDNGTQFSKAYDAMTKALEEYNRATPQ